MSYDNKFRPIIGHWNEKTFLTQTGALGATFHLSGQNAELMNEAAHVVARATTNQLALTVTHPRLIWRHHFTRISGQKAPILASCQTWWAKSLDEGIMQYCMNDLYRNDLFFTIILKPRPEFGKWLTGFIKRGIKPTATRDFTEEFEDSVAKTVAAFAHLKINRLGMRQDQEDGGWYSEILEAHHLIGNGFFRRIPMANGNDRAGRSIIPVRPVFHHRDYQLLTEGFETWGAILGFINYPSHTHPSMFEQLKSAGFDFTLSNSYQFRPTQKSIDRLDNKSKANSAANDSETQAAVLKRNKTALQDNATAYGTHSFSLTVRAPTQHALNHAIWKAEELVAKGKATIARYDSKGIVAAFYSQFPANERWFVRRGGVPAENFAGFAAMSNVPRGKATSRWGCAIMNVRTTQNTVVPYHFHVTGSPDIPEEDVANFTTVGGTGIGKTTWTARKIASAQRVGARSIILDKDCGLAPLVLALDGEYFVLEDGEDTGVNPLKGLPGTSADITHLHQLFLGLIESDGRGSITSSEDEALGQQIQFQMTLPKELRAIDGIWPLLGSGSEGAGARLRKWGRSGRLGWVFDGVEDRMNLTARTLGYDTSALLENPAVCEPLLTHMMYRFQTIIYQRKPLVLVLDECWKTIGKNEGATVDNSRLIAGFDDYSKTIRKNEGAIGLVTQSSSALLRSTMSRTIQQNFPTKEFFADRSAMKEDLIEGFGLTDREYEVVTRILPSQRHSVLVKRPDSSFIAVNDLSGVASHVTVLSGRRSTYDLIRVLQKRLGLSSRAWVPLYQDLAPRLVANPHLEPEDLVSEAMTMATA